MAISYHVDISVSFFKMSHSQQPQNNLIEMDDQYAMQVYLSLYYIPIPTSRYRRFPFQHIFNEDVLSDFVN